MATPKSTKPPAEPVNSEQADALEALRQEEAHPPVAAEAATQGPGVGELEERAVLAEERAEAAERKVETLSSEFDELKRQMALLMRSQTKPARDTRGPGDDEDEEELRGGVPVFNEDEPYGTVVGDPLVAYVQDGHQFGRDRLYVATEKHRGSPRPFNPRMVGWVKPRPNQANVDVLDGIRGRD